MSSPPLSPSHHHLETPQPPAKTGLRLVLPSLSALKAQKSRKRIKLTYDEPVKKIPRPIKLKPLKEVLQRLIAQIKKKDDYAFFLKPVDVENVPGYAALIPHPMDLGTMSTKVDKGRYRSLEEFADDLRLVTKNAKVFNPPGSIYYTEAERIEAYALEHITKAAATVIEYETDWNIEIEKDDEPPVAVDDDDGTPMDVDESRAGSPSVASNPASQSRRPKGKKTPGTLSETLEADGGLPGAKDGLGAFPPGSEWADLMLALKIKGKKYRTKRERMRVEKEGPPSAPDGSLDYWETEDPFTILSFFVPEPSSRPLLTPLFVSEPPLPAPVHIPPVQNPPDLPTLAPLPQKQTQRSKAPKRRHWNITRNALSRTRAKEKEDEEPPPPWATEREPVATDYGTFAMLPSQLVQPGEKPISSEPKFVETLRTSIDEPPQVEQIPSIEGEDDRAYWRSRAAHAEAYLKDLVYGGVDGYAYVRSVAEFLSPPDLPRNDEDPTTYDGLGMPVARWVENNVVDPLTEGRHNVLTNTVRILQGRAPWPPHPPLLSIPEGTSSPAPFPASLDPDAIAAQIDRTLHTNPAAERALATLRTLATAPVDLASLIRSPQELFHVEDMWAGKLYAERKRQQEKEMEDLLVDDPAKYLEWAIKEHREASVPSAETGATAKAKIADDPEMLAFAIEHAAEIIERLARGERTSQGVKAEHDSDVEMKVEEEESDADAPPADGKTRDKEDPELKNLRLNLLALAKRLPLDQITKLPAELIPAHLRHILPTADKT